ncbi:MAG TPA: hypothetical protein VIG32_04410 [Candidatus Baltobacteraceae bacterium]|jgi:hypothetical protein
MNLRGQKLDLALYVQALPVYARNLGVLVPPFVAAVIGLLLSYLSGPFTDPLGGAGASIFGLISQLVFGFSFGVALIFADDAWRHNRANLSNAWAEARRKAGNILIATLGFYFLIYIAQLIGGIFGAVGSSLFAAVATFFLIYALPAAAIGGAYSAEVFSISIRRARGEPLATAILTIVSLFVYFYIGFMLLPLFGSALGYGAIVLQLLLPSVAIGYVALVVAKQYADLAFGRRW